MARPGDKKQRLLAGKVAKAAAVPPKVSTAVKTAAPPTQLLDLVETFLSDHGFDSAHREFQKHRAKKSLVSADAKQKKPTSSLDILFKTWQMSSPKDNKLLSNYSKPASVFAKATKESSIDESGSSCSSSNDDSSSEAGGDIDMVDAPAVVAETSPLSPIPRSKPHSGDTDSDDESDTGSDDESDTGSDGESHAEKKATLKASVAKPTVPLKNSIKRKAVLQSTSSSHASSSGEDDSDTQKTLKSAATRPALPLMSSLKRKAEPESASSLSSSGYDSSSESEAEKPAVKRAKVEKPSTTKAEKPAAKKAEKPAAKKAEKPAVKINEKAAAKQAEKGAAKKIEQPAAKKAEKPAAKKAEKPGATKAEKVAVKQATSGVAVSSGSKKYPSSSETSNVSADEKLSAKTGSVASAAKTRVAVSSKKRKSTSSDPSSESSDGSSRARPAAKRSTRVNRGSAGPAAKTLANAGQKGISIRAAADKTGSKPDPSSAGSGSSSYDSDSDSQQSDDSVDQAEETRKTQTAAAGTALPESEASSYSSSSDGQDEVTKPKSGPGSDSSATLGKASPEVFPLSAFAPLPPNPVKVNNRGTNDGKKVNEPFSRIRKDIQVDRRLSSNAYIEHDYGRKAHEDLVVTRGKGFTKEKNKKKRGSYRGGPLDVNMSRSIKFDD